MSMFFGNEHKINRLKSEVSGVITYGGRLVPIIDILYQGGRNLLILEKEPNESILNYHQEELNLSLPDFMLLPLELYESVKTDHPANLISDKLGNLVLSIARHPAIWIDGFVTDGILIAWAEKIKKSTINTEDECWKGNNKFHLYYHLLERGLPVFDTEVATSPDDVGRGLAALRSKGYEKAAVKSQIGASGIGMLRFETGAEDPTVPEYMFYEGPCLIQGWIELGALGIERVDSPSVQLFINDRSINIYDITEQILSKDRIHEGNIAPPPYLEGLAALYDELVLQALEAADWLYKQGYRGTASVDFLVVKRYGKTEVRICEINARVTGATYPAILARRFMPKGAWLMRNMRTNFPMQGEELLRILDKAGVLYYPDKTDGFLPINFNLDRLGRVTKGQFLYLGRNLKACMEAIENFRKILPVDWQYDRD
jgi:hypothetical protein